MLDAALISKSRARVPRLLAAGLGALLLLSVLLLFLSWRGLEEIVPVQERLLTEFQMMTQQTNEMENAVLAMLADARGFIATGLREYEAGFTEDRRTFREAAGKVRVFMDEPAEKRLFDSVLQGESEVCFRLEQEIALRRRGKTPDQALAIVTRQDRQARLALRSAQAKLSGLAERELAEQIARLYRTQTRVAEELGALALAGLAVGLLFSFWWARRLSSLYEALDRLSRLKGEFLAIASHDLRTPLTTLHGVSQMLVAGDLGRLTDDGRRLVETMRDESDRMRRLIETYLDLTRLEEGVLTLRRVPVDMNALVHDHLERLRPQFDLRRVELAFESDGAVAPVVGDPDRLTQVLDNLLTNAVKFSPAGGRVRVAVAAGPGGVRIAVVDDGPGLTEGEMERIFDRLSQGEAGRRTEGGLGLGLAVAREIVSRHGGRLWAESDGVGRGARFVAELPVDGGSVAPSVS